VFPRVADEQRDRSGNLRAVVILDLEGDQASVKLQQFGREMRSERGLVIRQIGQCVCLHGGVLPEPGFGQT
jgi:hypothetical protein